LSIRPTYETVAADVYWVFGLALKERLCFVPSCYCQKRVYPASTSAQWGPRKIRHLVNAFTVLCSYLRDFAPSRVEACYAVATMFLWILQRMVNVLTRGRRWIPPLQVQTSLRKFLEGALLTRSEREK
jgi:hypothetical protein